MNDREKGCVAFVSHCDETGCSLGYAEYDCPACGRECECFDRLWWGRDDIHDGTPLEFACPKCGAKLKASYDEEWFDVFVEEVANGTA